MRSGVLCVIYGEREIGENIVQEGHSSILADSHSMTHNSTWQRAMASCTLTLTIASQRACEKQRYNLSGSHAPNTFGYVRMQRCVARSINKCFVRFASTRIDNWRQLINTVTY